VRCGRGLLHEWHAEHLPERANVLQWHVSAMLRNECEYLPGSARLPGCDVHQQHLRYGQSEQWDGLHAQWWGEWGLLQWRLRAMHRPHQLPHAASVQGRHVHQQPV
jgi:hypothetical protein